MMIALFVCAIELDLGGLFSIFKVPRLEYRMQIPSNSISLASPQGAFVSCFRSRIPGQATRRFSRRDCFSCPTLSRGVLILWVCRACRAAVEG